MKKSRCGNADRMCWRNRIADGATAFPVWVPDRARPVMRCRRRRRGGAAGADTALPSDGPCLRPVGVERTRPAVESPAISLPPALWAGIHSAARVRAAFDRRHRSRHRVGGDHAKTLVIGCSGYCAPPAPMRRCRAAGPCHSHRHHVVRRNAPISQERVRSGCCRPLAAPHPITLPPLRHKRSALRSRREKSLSDPITTSCRVVSSGLLLNQHQ